MRISGNKFDVRRMAFVLAMFSLCFMCVSAKGNDGKAVMRFAEETFDFGTVKEDGGSVSHDFEFVNIGNANLVINDCTVECGCTRPEFPKKPIAPGKKSKIKVTYNPKGRVGSFNKTVTVKTNGKPGKVRLKIRGQVVPGK